MAGLNADALQANLNAAKGLTPQQRQEWEADIASWRAAQQAGADQAVPADTDHPFHWQARLTKAERSEMQVAHSKFYNQVRDECNSMDHMQIGTKKN